SRCAGPSFLRSSSLPGLSVVLMAKGIALSVGVAVFPMILLVRDDRRRGTLFVPITTCLRGIAGGYRRSIPDRAGRNSPRTTHRRRFDQPHGDEAGNPSRR